MAQEITSSKRAKIICPEVSKLAEAVTLARENQMPYQETLTTINIAARLEQNEYEILKEMVFYIYQHPEKPIYENSMYILLECYKKVN